MDILWAIGRRRPQLETESVKRGLTEVNQSIEDKADEAIPILSQCDPVVFACSRRRISLPLRN
jgi:hypothetical protein